MIYVRPYSSGPLCDGWMTIVTWVCGSQVHWHTSLLYLSDHIYLVSRSSPFEGPLVWGLPVLCCTSLSRTCLTICPVLAAYTLNHVVNNTCTHNIYFLSIACTEISYFVIRPFATGWYQTVCQSEHTKTDRQEVSRGYEPKDLDALLVIKSAVLSNHIWLYFLVAELNQIKSNQINWGVGRSSKVFNHPYQ